MVTASFFYSLSYDLKHRINRSTGVGGQRYETTERLRGYTILFVQLKERFGGFVIVGMELDLRKV